MGNDSAKNIPIYKLIRALYEMQSKGYRFADLRIEDDFNVVIKPSEINFKDSSTPPPTLPEDTDLSSLI